MTGGSDFNKIRSAFRRRASAPNVTPFALKLAYLLAFKYMNKETQTARPAQETLARDLNVDERSIRRLLDILQPLGLTVVPGNGRGLASSYCIDPERATRDRKADTRVHLFGPERRTPESTFAPKGGLWRHQKADSRVRPT
jgi:hypothetical protein